MAIAQSDAQDVLCITDNVCGLTPGQRVLGFVSKSGDARVSFNGNRLTVPAGLFYVVRLDTAVSESKPDARSEEYQEAPKT